MFVEAQLTQRITKVMKHLLWDLNDELQSVETFIWTTQLLFVANIKTYQNTIIIYSEGLNPGLNLRLDRG